MKRLTQLFCIATVLTLVGCAPSSPKEKFKEYHEIVFRIDEGTRVKKNEWKYVQEYDDQGEVCKILYYEDDGMLSRYSERNVDHQSGIVTQTSFDASGTKQDWSEAQLQDEKVIWHKHYDSEGALMQIIQSKYDDQSRQTEALYLKGDGSVLHKLVYVYDDKENTKTRTTYDADGQQEPGKIVNIYDSENKNLIKQDWYDSPDRVHLTFDYTYLDGKRQSETQSSFGKAFKKRTYKYDKRGNATEIHTYKSDGESEELILREIKVVNYKY